MISPEVGAVPFSSSYQHIDWSADCQSGFLTTFYLFTLQYFSSFGSIDPENPIEKRARLDFCRSLRVWSAFVSSGYHHIMILAS